jgi:hypothetical protein
MKSFATLLALVFITSAAHAKVFRNAYVSFDLPDKWDCAIESTEWVCRSSSPQVAKEAIIILTAKERGPTDELGAYETHLKSAKTILNRQGKEIQSKIIDIKQRQINGQTWVVGLQLNSEVPDYYTRYAATVKDNLGILVTFSAHQLVYTKYSNDFFNAILSLRVVADRNSLGGAGDSGGAGMLKPGSELLGPGQMGGFPQDFGADMPSDQNAKVGASVILAIVLLVVAGAIYIILKRRKKRRRPTK